MMISFLIGGCAGFSKNPVESSPCYGVAAEESKICQVIPNPQDVDFALRLSNAAALKGNMYRAEEAMAAVDRLIDVAKKGSITVSDFYRLLVKEVDPLIFTVIDEYKARFLAIDGLLTTKDLDMIIIHLERQKLLIGLALNSK